MKKLLFLAVPFLGFGLAKGEAIVMEQKSDMVEIVKLDPRKNYRAKLARQFCSVGSSGSYCRDLGSPPPPPPPPPTDCMDCPCS